MEKFRNTRLTEQVPNPKLTERVRASGRRYLVAKFNGRQIAFGAADDPETQRRYDRFLGDWIANGRRLRDPAGSNAPAPALSVQALLDAYEVHAAVYYRHPDGTPTGRTTSIKAALRDIRELFAAHPVTAFTLQHLKAVRERMIERGLARKVINSRIGAIRRAFSWGVEERMVPSTVTADLRELKSLQAGRSAARETPKRTAVSETAMKEALPHLAPHLRALVLAMWHSGMRCGEAVQLRTADVDMTGDVWVFRPRIHKNLWREKSREIDIGPNAQKVLRPFVCLDRERFWFRPGDGVEALHASRAANRKSPPRADLAERQAQGKLARAARRADPKWAEDYTARDKHNRKPPSVPGDRYDTKAIAHAIRRACNAAKIPVWSPHQLRHAALTRIRKQRGLEAAVACGGHGSPVVTEEYTRGAARELARSAALELG